MVAALSPPVTKYQRSFSAGFQGSALSHTHPSFTLRRRSLRWWLAAAGGALLDLGFKLERSGQLDGRLWGTVSGVSFLFRAMWLVRGKKKHSTVSLAELASGRVECHTITAT